MENYKLASCFIADVDGWDDTEGADDTDSKWALFFIKNEASQLMGSAGLSLDKVLKPCIKMGTTVWSRY